MDPASLFGLTLTIADILRCILDYSIEAKGAQQAITTISEELFALKGVLLHIESQQNVPSHSPTNQVKQFDSKTFRQMLESTNTFLTTLLKGLEIPASRSKRIKQALKWPLDKDETAQHIERINRAKSWFILVMMTDDLALTRETYSSVCVLTELLQNMQLTGNSHNPESATQQLIDWLAPFRPEDMHQRVSAMRHPQSGMWFVDGALSDFLQQKPGSNSILWLSGKSGTGKTTLFSLAVETVQQLTASSNNDVAAFHYCSFSNPESQLPINILGSLAVQLSSIEDGILEDLKMFYERDQSTQQRKTLLTNEIQSVLVKHLARFENVYLLFDALNESVHFHEVVKCILSLLQQLPNIKVLITSTTTADTSDAGKWQHLLRAEMRSDQDIVTFVDSSLAEQPALRYLSYDYKEKIRSLLLAKADHMFRWVQLTLDNLCQQRTGKAVMKAITQIPEGLNITYSSMLSRIPLADKIIAREALLWLAFAERPLTLLELSEAVVIEESDTTLDLDSRLTSPEVILEICSGLIDYDHLTREVKLAHSSVQDYLVCESGETGTKSQFRFTKELGHRTLMRKCLTYLMFGDFNIGVVDQLNYQDSIPARAKIFPLLTYAAYYWTFHAAFASDADWDLADKLFSTKDLPRGGNYGAWVNCLLPSTSPDAILKTEPLYYAASFGLTALVKRLLEQPGSVNLEQQGGRYGSTPLQVACFRQQRGAVELLLAAGADFWSKDRGSSASAFFWAQCNGWDDLVEWMKKNWPWFTRKSLLKDAWAEEEARFLRSKDRLNYMARLQMMKKNMDPYRTSKS